MLVPTARLAMSAPPEKHAFVAALAPDRKSRPDAFLAVDLEQESPTRSEIVGRQEPPDTGDELHHFGWNAFSPYVPHLHVERRYLIVPGLRSFWIHVIDTKPDVRKLAI